MLIRYGLGTAPNATAYTQWTESVHALLEQLYGDAWRVHGGAVVMPSNVPAMMQPYIGQPAAMYDNDTYTALANGGYIDLSSPQVASASGKVVFVLAPPGVIAAAPPTMNILQRTANAVFTTGDIAADAAGLPSLSGIEDTLKGVGRDVLVGVGVTLAVALVLKMRKR